MATTKFVSCDPRGVHLGSERFPGNTEKPRLRPWRCELTACSRYTNFYFVAHGKVISVYEPLFGDQALGSPVIVLHPPVSVPAPQGYIDPRNPHDIDRLHVDYLGRKEVLLVACDDGDVVGYYVSAIKNAVEGRTPGAPVQEPRPFLHTNVRLSAWGLSVHRRARLLAISSNTGIITVIAFALASNNGDGGRAHSVKEFNVGHNIPFISFNNSGTDPEGRWLLSASISGDAQLWDLHRSGEQGPVLKARLDSCQEDRPTCICCGEDTHHTWGAAFIDSNQCHEAKSFNDAFGGQPWGPQVGHHVWDISELKEVRAHRFRPDAYHNITNSFGVDIDLSGALDFASDDSGAPETDLFVTEDEHMETDLAEDVEITESGGAGHPDEERRIRWLDEKNKIRWLHSDSESPDPYSDLDLDERDEPGILGITCPTPKYIPTAAPVDASQILQGWAEEIQVGSVREGWEYRGKLSFRLPSDLAMPYCPYIIVCKNEVYLFQPGNPASPSTYSLANLRPIIAAPEPLKPPDTLSSHWDRMNYSLYIAELGIFLVAAPSGRCAIFTLTQYNIPVKDSPNQTKTIYGMRQDYTLPFKEQEEQDPRFKDCWRNGRVLLVGIAAGPAQGCMDKEEDERGSGSESESEEEWHGPRLWRLFLHYSDHTVLTYELVRKARGLEQDWGVLPAW